jgi:hypothetical protein
MNIHLPAILMFTRGTRFWHTAICWEFHGLLVGFKLCFFFSCFFMFFFGGF